MLHMRSRLCLVLALSAPVAASATDTTELKTTLQTSLQRNIERQLIDGGLHRMNLETGEVEVFYPVDTHPMIVRMGEMYVMCSDLKRADGSSSTVDYYLARKGARYAIIQTEIGNRAPLKSLMRQGKAKLLK